MAPTQQAMSSGSVVFSLPHIRDAIFGYHAEELLKERNAQLQAIARPVTAAFWESFAKADGRVMPAEYFAKKREALSQHTDVFHVMDKLGLKLASYIEFLASRPHDVRFWVSACSALGGSRKWEGSGFRDYRLEAAPRDTPDNGVHEEPDSIPAQMLMTASINYRNGMHGHYGDKWAETEGLAHLLRDKAGRIFVMRLLDIDLQPFLFDMAAKHPERLLSDDSPFFPIYEVLSYNSQVGIAIWQPPPHPLGYSLFPDSGRDELRRVLERAHDLFANLATLERWGVSLNAGYISSHWERWITTWGKGNGCIVPAYLRKVVSEKDPGKLAPAYLYEERLPSPPATAWPIAPLSGNGGIAGLPWSQITAYNDPRVGGPRFFFYGVVVANQSDADFQQADLKRQLEPNQRPTTRFHDDLLNVTIELLNRFFPDHKRDIYALLLRSQSTADIYEQTLRSDVDTTPRDCQTGHSGLFTFCANCVHHLQPKDDNAAYDPTSSKCRSCGRYYIVHALPDAVRRLFLRIVEPETREDGSKIIVTAKEAYDVMKEVMAAEIPRLESYYTAWADKQKTVQRMATAGPLAFSKISKDVSASRWTMLEMLRGNLLDGKYRRPEQVALRDAMKAFHEHREKERLEREAKRARAEQRSEEAASGGSAPSTAADEAAVSAFLPAAAPEGAKRPAKGGIGAAKTAKKSKAG